MATQQAIVTQGAGNAGVVQVPVPSPKGKSIVVKTAAVALNPIDAVFIDYMPAPGCIVGCDYSGVVESIGDGVDGDVKVGDRVGGYIMGCTHNVTLDPCYASIFSFWLRGSALLRVLSSCLTLSFCLVTINSR